MYWDFECSVNLEGHKMKAVGIPQVLDLDRFRIIICHETIFSDAKFKKICAKTQKMQVLEG